jgi:hypothetical protein
MASIQSLAMLGGTLIYAQIFGYFIRPDAVLVSTGMAFFVSAALCACLLAYFLAARKPAPA